MVFIDTDKRNFMELSDDDIRNLVTNSNLNSNEVTIDFINKRIYVDSIRDNIDQTKQFMIDNNFRYVGETIQIAYDHEHCGCTEDTYSETIVQDPEPCYILQSSSSQSSNNVEYCDSTVNFITTYANEFTKNPKITETLTLDATCEEGNCSWKREQDPIFIQVFDATNQRIYYKQINELSQLKVEKVNNRDKYIFRKFKETSFFNTTSASPSGNYEVILSDCALLSQTDPERKEIQIVVLENFKEDLDNLIYNFPRVNDYDFNTYAHVDHAKNDCNLASTGDAEGNYTENLTLYNEWRTILLRNSNWTVTKFTF
jgi:hypothetical protein